MNKIILLSDKEIATISGGIEIGVYNFAGVLLGTAVAFYYTGNLVATATTSELIKCLEKCIKDNKGFLISCNAQTIECEKKCIEKHEGLLDKVAKALWLR